MFASMAACMLNKFLGSKIQKFEQKMSTKVLEVGTEFNSLISEELRDVNSLNSYLKREQFFMEKATKQLQGLENLKEQTK